MESEALIESERPHYLVQHMSVVLFCVLFLVGLGLIMFPAIIAVCGFAIYGDSIYYILYLAFGLTLADMFSSLQPRKTTFVAHLINVFIMFIYGDQLYGVLYLAYVIIGYPITIIILIRHELIHWPETMLWQKIGDAFSETEEHKRETISSLITAMGLVLIWISMVYAFASAAPTAVLLCLGAVLTMLTLDWIFITFTYSNILIMLITMIVIVDAGRFDMLAIVMIYAMLVGGVILRWKEHVNYAIW